MAFVVSDSDNEEAQYDNDHFVESDVRDPEAEIQSLKLLVSQLQGELEKARNSAARSVFCLENIHKGR